jgi:serine/alanine adding enzyme
MQSSALLDAEPSVATPQISEATGADESAWDSYVSSHPDATGYHTWAWRRVFKNALGHESIYLVAQNRGTVSGVLPLVLIRSPLFGKSLTSLAFLNYGGVVADTDHVAHTLLAAAGDIARREACGHVELRHIGRRFPALPCREHKVTMLLTLEPGMWERLDRKVRNQIRKAQKSDLAVERGGANLLPDFYSVFARNMRDLGTPVYSPKLFAEVLRHFPDRAGVHIVRLAGKPIAGGLTFRTDRRVEVPWASSIRDYNNLCPNHLLYWNILETALEQGCTTMDFGRSTPHEGTYKFKEQWGAQAVPLHWEYILTKGTELPEIGPKNPKYRFMIETWKKLPLSVATRLGPHIVRGIP